MVDNPPAFPTQYTLGPNAGMTLRDWFAGQALAGLGEWYPPTDDGRWPDADFTRSARARWAYEQADAMLAERNT